MSAAELTFRGCATRPTYNNSDMALKSDITWANVASKPSYYDAKAIKTITRSGTTFTYTCLDGTTGTFTQQDNNTTYTFSANNPTLAWGTTSTIGTAGGTTYKITMPANPNTWRGIQNNLTSTSTTESLSAYQGKVLNDSLSDKASISTANTYDGEQKFQNAQYCPTAQDNASGVGTAYKASRGAVNQEIVGQIIMPYTSCSDEYGCENIANTIKFQKITASNSGNPTLSTIATLTDTQF